MKKCIIFCLFLFITRVAISDNIKYTYDAAGNLVLRQYIEIKLKSTDVIGSENLSIENDFSERKIKIYPNPTKGILRVEISGVKAGDEIYFALSNMLGKLLQRMQGSETFSIDLTSYTEDLYILSLYINNEKIDYKIIKE